MFRKTIFWLHLGIGVVVGLVVAMMAFTGVLLTYEHQLVSRADSSSWPAAPDGAVRLGVGEIAARAEASGVAARRLTYFRDDATPVLVGGGRRDPSTYVDGYTGSVLGQPDNATRDLMRALTAWHRWFAADGESRAAARLVTGGSNLAFLFLIVTGAYLWLPKVFRWPLFRQRLRFANGYRNSRDRDFYWHHIFAAWAAVPLIVIVVTAIVISFPWANKLLTGMAGDAPGRPLVAEIPDVPDESARMSLDDLLRLAMTQSESWHSIALLMPDEGSRTVSFEIDTGSGRQPHRRRTVMLDAVTGDAVGSSGFADRPAARRAIAWNRYLHTGESFGFVGQTIAGLATLACLVLVWTGLALAWRRLVVPIYRRTFRGTIPIIEGKQHE